jgi:hypothetical protein
MRRVDDRGKLTNPIHAEVGDRGGTALIVLERETARPRTLGKLAHLGRDHAERLRVSPADDRCDQPAVNRDRDSDVNMGKA